MDDVAHAQAVVEKAKEKVESAQQREVANEAHKNVA